MVNTTGAVSINMLNTGFEGFIGNSGSDTVDARGVATGILAYGLDGNDTFYNGAGADFFEGGAHSDTVIYAGNSSAYTITQLGALYYEVTTGGVTDIVANIEMLRFDNGSILLV